MKKILMGMAIVLAVLMSMPVHALLHSLTNGSDTTIDVFMYLHGESMLGTNAQTCLNSIWTSCCRREKRGLKPGEWVEWDTGGCQLRRVRVVESGTDNQAQVYVRNTSRNVLKDVGVGVVVAPIIAGTFVVDSASAGLLGGGVKAAGKAAGKSIWKKARKATIQEVVAYGSTSWIFDNEGLRAVGGVKVYAK